MTNHDKLAMAAVDAYRDALRNGLSTRKARRAACNAVAAAAAKIGDRYYFGHRTKTPGRARPSIAVLGG